MRLIPAPRGTGIVAAGVPKKLLNMAGIEDCYTQVCSFDYIHLVKYLLNDAFPPTLQFCNNDADKSHHPLFLSLAQSQLLFVHRWPFLLFWAFLF